MSYANVLREIEAHVDLFEDQLKKELDAKPSWGKVELREVIQRARRKALVRSMNEMERKEYSTDPERVGF